MDSRFKNIDAEKRDRIINAALDEFAKNGYDKASTNEIVKKANISRGLLYHYFKDKKELYDVLSKYAVNMLVEKVDEAIDYNERDVLERIKQIAFVKMRLMAVYPSMFTFVLRLFTNKDKVQSTKGAYELYESFGVDVQQIFTKVYQENVDYSLFRESENIEVNMNIVRWTIEKWGDEIFPQIGADFCIDDMSKYAEQLDKYINVLKRAFY